MSNCLDPDPKDPDPLGAFCNINYSKISFRSTIRVSNCLDPDQDRQNVGPNCLQRLSVDDKSPRAR